MKHSFYQLRNLKSTAIKLFFCSQLVVTALALPSLFYVGITYNADNETPKGKRITMTNKGKKIIVMEKAENNNTAIFPAFVQR